MTNLDNLLTLVREQSSAIHDATERVRETFYSVFKTDEDCELVGDYPFFGHDYEGEVALNVNEGTINDIPVTALTADAERLTIMWKFYYASSCIAYLNRILRKNQQVMDEYIGNGNDPEDNAYKQVEGNQNRLREGIGDYTNQRASLLAHDPAADTLTVHLMGE